MATVLNRVDGGSRSSADTDSVLRYRLHDGRMLAYAEYGDPNGVAAFYFHGTTSSRLEGALYHGVAREHGVRLITVDRPGVGRSDPLPGRKLVDWPGDVAELADHLRLRDYVVAGGSGGGPHALACAALTPQRVRGVVLVNTAVPPQKRYWKRMPFPMRLLLWLFLHARPVAGYLVRKMAAGRDPAMLRDDRRYARARRFLPAGDRHVMDDESRRHLFADAVAEGLRQDRLCFATEAWIFLGNGEASWGFDPLTVKVPVVALCGALDGSGVFAAELVERCGEGSRLQRFAGGHLSALGEEAAQLSMRAIAELYPPKSPPTGVYSSERLH